MKKNYFVLLSFTIWFIPFCIRIPMNITNQQYQESKNINQKNTITAVQEAFAEKKNSDAFVMVFENNIEGCIYNVCGGVLLGLGTIVNLAFNGFASSDMFINIHHCGLPLTDILKCTLPHSFELIGFWLSGAMGLIIAHQLFRFMRGREAFDRKLIHHLITSAVVVFIIILCAAFVETHISINMV